MKENPTQEGIDKVKKLVGTYIALLKIKAIKKIVQLLTKTSLTFIYIFFILIGMVFLGIALSLFLGYLLNSYALGFLITGAIPLLIVLFIRLLRKKFNVFLRNIFTRFITSNDDL